jgi:hypothetical protein
MAARNTEGRLEVAAERIRALELQIFERDREAQDRDVELTTLLDAPAPRAAKPLRSAARHRFATTMAITIDATPGELIDLSVGGAQVLCARKPEVNNIVALVLSSDKPAVTCRGRIVWAWLEPHSQRRALRYRAGLLFTQSDEAAIEDFIARHGAT